MVYAVAMTTIGHFERALGRVALWSSHRETEASDDEQFVRRLRIYPHALRDRNAYYSPDKKALLFGYFPVGIKDAHNTPGTLVFTCLSHDIIAHETTHALLDGVHPRFNEPVNADVLAFHEAFADIVALFQHFSYPGVLRDQIARTRGNLASENLLGQLAQQFGQAPGAAARCATRSGDERSGDRASGSRTQPDVRVLDRTLEPHDRGAILVAAVFGAFLKVYRARTADLYRIATEGTGVLPEGDIHPDLANRLADEAARAAQLRAADVHPRHRLLPAGRHHVRRLPARHHHRRPRLQPGRPESAIAWRSSRASGNGASIPGACAACRSRACSGRPATACRARSRRCGVDRGRADRR